MIFCKYLICLFAFLSLTAASNFCLAANPANTDFAPEAPLKVQMRDLDECLSRTRRALEDIGREAGRRQQPRGMYPSGYAMNPLNGSDTGWPMIWQDAKSTDTPYLVPRKDWLEKSASQLDDLLARARVLEALIDKDVATLKDQDQKKYEKARVELDVVGDAQKQLEAGIADLKSIIAKPDLSGSNVDLGRRTHALLTILKGMSKSADNAWDLLHIRNDN